MQDTDIPYNGYADRQTQEKEIQNIVKAFDENDNSAPWGYKSLLDSVSLHNLVTITNELAKQLVRLDK